MQHKTRGRDRGDKHESTCNDKEEEANEKQGTQGK